MSRYPPIEGTGLGLRAPYVEKVISLLPPVAWWEVITENYFHCGETHLRVLHSIAENYPLVFHGVGLNLGSSEELDLNYLYQLRELVGQYQPAWVSDHLCWTGQRKFSSRDLLPLPMNLSTIKYLSNRIEKVQEILRRPLVLENISAYFRMGEAEFTEGEFLASIVRQSGCELLVDLNNMYVNSVNFGFDPVAEMKRLPKNAVREIHVAGHERWQNFLVDSHSGPEGPEVRSLLKVAMELWGEIPVLLEWDQNFPKWERWLESYESLAAYQRELGASLHGMTEVLSGKETQLRGVGSECAPTFNLDARLKEKKAEDDNFRNHLEWDQFNFISGTYGAVAPLDQGQSVYRRHFFYSSFEALQSLYPILHLGLGTNNFRYLTKQHFLQQMAAPLAALSDEKAQLIRECRPSIDPRLFSFDLLNLGQNLSETLDQCPELDAEKYWVDLARLEWAWEWINRKKVDSEEPVLYVSGRSFVDSQKDHSICVAEDGVQVHLRYGEWPQNWPLILQMDQVELLDYFSKLVEAEAFVLMTVGSDN